MSFGLILIGRHSYGMGATSPIERRAQSHPGEPGTSKRLHWNEATKVKQVVKLFVVQLRTSKWRNTMF